MCPVVEQEVSIPGILSILESMRNIVPVVEPIEKNVLRPLGKSVLGNPAWCPLTDRIQWDHGGPVTTSYQWSTLHKSTWKNWRVSASKDKSVPAGNSSWYPSTEGIPALTQSSGLCEKGPWIVPVTLDVISWKSAPQAVSGMVLKGGPCTLLWHQDNNTINDGFEALVLEQFWSLEGSDSGANNSRDYLLEDCSVCSVLFLSEPEVSIPKEIEVSR